MIREINPALFQIKNSYGNWLLEPKLEKALKLASRPTQGKNQDNQESMT
jgi:hypothetical protein